MYKNIELINTQLHKNHSVKLTDGFGYAKEHMSVPITAAEFYESCKDYPILFVKDATDNWSASAMLGYQEGVNLFIDKKGAWEKSRYIPASIRRYPFIFVAQENRELSLAIDTDALSLSDADKERKLFTDDEKPSEFTTSVLGFMGQFQRDAQATSEFIAQLDKLGLLEEKIAHVITADEKSHQINGFYTINEEKLQHLSKKKKEEICDRNVYPLIIAHLISLSNIQRLGIK